MAGYLTKRMKASTPEHEEVDKRKCRMCLGGHKAIEGVHYNRIDAYVPVPTWTTIKLQLALTSRHRLQLKAFNCVAAYLQADFKDPLYVYPPKGLMQELGQDPNKIWKLNKALYGWPPPGRIWFDKVSTWLHDYGFCTLGNSDTFMMLDRQDLPGDAGGLILLNLYSDDRTALNPPTTKLYGTRSWSILRRHSMNLKRTQNISSDVPSSGILSLVLSSLTRENICAKSLPSMT